MTEEVCTYKRSGPLGYFMGPIYHWIAGCNGRNEGEDYPYWPYCRWCGKPIETEDEEEDDDE